MLLMLITAGNGELLKASSNPVAAVFSLLFKGLFIAFYAYQLYFFSRTDVKAFCKKVSYRF